MNSNSNSGLNNIIVFGSCVVIIAVIIIIVTGLTLAFGDTSGGFRRLVQIVFGLSIAFAASSFFLSFFSFGGGCRTETYRSGGSGQSAGKLRESSATTCTSTTPLCWRPGRPRNRYHTHIIENHNE